jgi:hypothetical protein
MARPAQTVVELFRPRTWRAKVAAVARKSIPGEVLTRLKATPGEEMYEDTMEYLETAYRKSGHAFNSSTAETLVETILSRFSLFRGFHGCRPLSLKSYQRDGLVLLTRQRLAQYAYAVFDGDISLVELQRRADQADINTRLGRIHFCADSNELISQCGHYLIYGSEALTCLWQSRDPENSRRFHELQERSRSKGIPTVFICDVPIDSMEASSRTELGKTLLTFHLQLASDSPVRPEDWSRNWGYGITRDLPSTHIKSHFHPEQIPDPLRRPAFCHNPQTRCEWCL